MTSTLHKHTLTPADECAMQSAGLNLGAIWSAVFSPKHTLTPTVGLEDDPKISYLTLFEEQLL